MRQSCVAHPPKGLYITIREWQVIACDGNHCAAALLSLFEHFHNIRIEQAEKAHQHNAVAQKHGDDPTQDTTLFQFHTEAQLSERLFGLYGNNVIRQAIRLLVSKGFISIHRNPNPRYAFDSTKHFLFYPDHVSDAAKVTDASVKNNARGVKNNGTSQRETKDKIKERSNTAARTPAPQAQDNPLCATKRAKRRARSSEQRAKFLTGTGLAQEELVTEIVTAFHSTYAEEKGEPHHWPLIPALTTAYQELDAACAEHALYTIGDWYPLIDQFFHRAAVPNGKFKSNGHLEHFATEGVLKYLAYQCGELAGYESEGD